MIETLIICTIFGVFIFAAFIVGLHYGSKVKNNERIELPNLNPVKAVKNHIKEKEVSAKQEKQDLIDEINLANIESYDGTGLGQIEIPK